MILYRHLRRFFAFIATVVLVLSFAGQAKATDLIVVKSTVSNASGAILDFIKPGDSFQYWITVMNISQVEAINVALTDQLPQQLIFDSASPAQGSCSQTANFLTCSLGNIPADGQVQVIVSVQLDSSTALNQNIVNEATATADNEVNPTDNSGDSTFVTAEVTEERGADTIGGCSLLKKKAQGYGH